MSVIYPNMNFPYAPMNLNVPFQRVYLNMKALTSTLIQSRIIQKKLVYIIGLSADLVKIEDKLKSYEYFGQYGKITKLVVNKNKTYNTNGPNGPSYTCFITYSCEAESSLAILSMDDCTIDNHEIKANYGTTKYCLNFLKNAECNNKDCIYLHQLANEKDIVSREQMNCDKDIFPQQRLMAIELSKILTDQKYTELYKLKDIKTVFPNGFSVYKKELVLRYMKEKKCGITLNLISIEIKPEDKKNVNGENKENNDKASQCNKDIMANGNKEEKKENESINNSNNFFRDYIKIKNSLKDIFKSAPRSRFSFAQSNLDGSDINQIVPSQINDFLTQQFTRHSNIYKEEQNLLADYYFSLKPNSLDSDESWSSLVSTLKKWDNKYESEEENLNKFNTY